MQPKPKQKAITISQHESYRLEEFFKQGYRFIAAVSSTKSTDYSSSRHEPVFLVILEEPVPVGEPYR